MTVSFTVLPRVATNYRVTLVLVNEADNTVASPSVESENQFIPVSSNRKRLEFTLPTPKPNDGTVGFKGVYLQVSLNYGGSTEQEGVAVIPDGRYDFMHVKAEFGSVATPFIPDTPATNLAKCQRYYWKSDRIQFGVPIRGGEGSNQSRCIITFPTTMRDVPTTSAKFRINGTGGFITAGTQLQSVDGFVAYPLPDEVAGGYVEYGSFIADAEL